MDADREREKVRLDKWLWAARFFKTRALAVEAIDGGKVLLNGERAKRAKGVQAGDTVRVRLGPYDHVVATTLYEETAESRAERERRALHLRSVTHDFAHEKGRPSKKERRDLHRFREGRE